VDAYRDGHDFEELLLVVDGADAIVPHRTVYAGKRFTLRIDTESAGQSWAGLGSRPWQSWASTWARLTAHPLETGRDKYDMVLDGNLRRIWGWSTVLQYLEDFEQWGERP